ncbi:MAG TPA: PIN domain-containing protein [Methanotrichaceae archaeon]|nr:PIN domain-containing protein [Methanotrichaceae archaeon]
MSLVVDASVFLAAARSDDENYAASRSFLRNAQSAGMMCPSLILPECAAVVAAQTGDEKLAGDLATIIEGFPGVQIVPLDQNMARRAAKMASDHRLRASDAVYAALAESFKAVLITWDTEMLQRCLAAVRTMEPSRWLEDTGERSGMTGLGVPVNR